MIDSTGSRMMRERDAGRSRRGGRGINPGANTLARLVFRQELSKEGHQLVLMG